MKIIKQGNISKINTMRKFECEKCGCIFECESNEYDTEFGYNNDFYISVNCPTCKYRIVLG